MLTVLTNIRSTDVSLQVENNLRWKMTFNGEETSKQGRRLRFGMLTVLTNIRSTKVLHHASCIIGYF